MFVHLHLHSPYSFGDGASDIEVLADQACAFGMPALALTDHDTVAAAVKFTQACEQRGIVPILGAEITLEDETHLTLLAENHSGYAHLCRLLSLSYTTDRRAPRLPWSALGITLPTPQRGWSHTQPRMDLSGILCLSGCRRGALFRAVHAHAHQTAVELALALRQAFGEHNLYLELQNDLTPHADRVNRELAELAGHIKVPAVATNNVHHARREDFVAWDILRAISTHTRVTDIHPLRPLNAERYLKSPEEMKQLFAWHPAAIEATMRIFERCERALPPPEDVTPAFGIPELHAEKDAAGYLRYLTYKGARARYRPLQNRIIQRMEHELNVIHQLGYNDYFLMAWQTARWARQQGIRVTGRGSAADSCVSYCLKLTDVDVVTRDLPFARFLTEGKVPDIDLDFPSNRRDEVFRHLMETYGHEHVANVCTFATYQAKGAVRDIGKALALPPETLTWFSQRLSHFSSPSHLREAFDKLAELREHRDLRDRFGLLFDLCRKIANFPRHISTHSSGVVISRIPLSCLAPIRPSARGLVQIWELDKDDAEVLGAIKLDILSLRTLAAVNDAEHSIICTTPDFRYNHIPEGDPDTYRMLQAGEAVGAFQLESSAQLSLACTLCPQHFEDLVASVALIRPGPVRGDAVKQFVNCRNGWMRASYLHPCLEPILQKTYGALVFQEQAIQVVSAMTGCSEAEADKFRKSLAKYARQGKMQELRQEFITTACRYHPDFDEVRADLLFNMLEGWSGFGFTEGHAASFALTAYRTAYLVEHHPAEYLAGMMSHQPMGFYSSNTLAAEARRRGVTVLPVDINASAGACAAPNKQTIRLGLQLVQGLRDGDVTAVVNGRAERPYRSLLDFCLRVPLRRDCLENLILAGAFDPLHEHRRGLIWRLDETLSLARTYRYTALENQPAFDLGAPVGVSTPIAADIPPFTPWDRFLWTWRLTGVCAECHVFSHLREDLSLLGIFTTYEAKQQRSGSVVQVAGLNIQPHRPPTKSGNPVLFTTVEDEFGLLQAVCVGEAIQTCTATFLTAAAVIVQGVIERKGNGVMLKVKGVKPLRMQDLVRVRSQHAPVGTLPLQRTYPGTVLTADAPA